MLSLRRDVMARKNTRSVVYIWVYYAVLWILPYFFEAWELPELSSKYTCNFDNGLFTIIVICRYLIAQPKQTKTITIKSTFFACNIVKILNNFGGAKAKNQIVIFQNVHEFLPAQDKKLHYTIITNPYLYKYMKAIKTRVPIFMIRYH